jgi:hypothetical protein
MNRHFSEWVVVVCLVIMLVGYLLAATLKH